MSTDDASAPATPAATATAGKATPLAPHYDPHAAALRYYPEWEASGVFRADPHAPGEPYCIVIPPPNVTGNLHMGHALNNTLQDVLIRYKRMDGYNVLWLPGTDHAGIATQWVVERQLRAQGIERREMGREKFLECVWQWKDQSGGNIVRQLRRLGVSCDWSRERFTMDEGLSKAVRENFVRLYEEGLIYRATRLINWDPVGLTALSDLEVETEEGVQGEIWSFAYTLTELAGAAEGETAQEIVVATTRPETMLGDTAIAVHPDDTRYAHLIGRTVRHPFVDREIPIIGDAILVDPAFGSGAVKVTPAHDFNDHEVGIRHNLPMISIFTPDGKVNANGGAYAGLDRFEARARVKADLEALGLFRGRQDHVMTLPKSQRSGAVVEPMISTQWFMRMKPLATPAVGAVEHGFTTFWPDQWKNTYFAWLKDVKEWCISRQLWWGHRIPAWHCGSCQHVTVGRTDPTECAKCGSTDLGQDEDVLDTWFSSALWPFSTLGWPEKTADLAKYYPTAVLLTGFDIIFFWVARMMFMGLHHMGQVPFKDVYIHGLVRDEHGDKMSKTKGNVVDPVQTIDRVGVDAFRMTLTALAGLGRDILWSEKQVEAWSKFQNKIWNAYRFLHMHVAEKPAPAVPGPYDRWILARLGTCVRNVRAALDGYRFDLATAEIYQFTWYELCDWYLEFSKPALYGPDDGAQGEAKRAARHTLWTVFHALSRLIHPIAPFFGEELWRNLPGHEAPDSGAGTVMLAAYPRGDDFPEDPVALAEIARVQDAIIAVRRIRSEKNLSPKIGLTAFNGGALTAAFASQAAALRDLANVVVATGERPAQAAVVVVAGEELWIDLAGVLDTSKERERLTREIERLDKSIQFLEARLGNEAFVAKAPPHLLDKSRAELAGEIDKRASLRGALAAV
ncbi:MAG: valine--tRNA ligase [Myxococcales bacterium]|nr:valine--tRNA ligase [Myxococcales bacterium]